MKQYSTNDIVSGKIEFGKLQITEELKSWQDVINGEIVSLCRGLPAGSQTEAFLMLMNYAGLNIGDKFDFFKKYYPCLWNILAHIAGLQKSGGPENFSEIIKSHAMAMFLHSIEDHLIDGELSPDILILLIHAEAWRIYRTNLDKISEFTGTNKDYIDKYLDRYFSSICSDPENPTLEDYCAHFRNQMANITLLADLCAVSVNIEEDKKADMLESFECFGIAWRLLDDINDFEEDFASGTRNACFYALDSGGQSLYESISGQKRGQSPDTTQARNTLIQHMDTEKTLITIIDAIISYLKRGAEAAFRSGINGFGEELLEMASPIEKKFYSS